MYQDYFGLTEDPFAITPDPKYLFLSDRHRNGFAHLLYGVTEGGGFLQLTGGVGTGKTLLCRKLLMELPRTVDVAFIFNPRLTPLELVATICDELKILYPLGCNSIKEVVDFLNAYLLESHSQGRRTVVIIDEAQNLSYESLEQIRLLTNLETDKHKLLQIILVGQPELKRLLQQQRLRQLAQRVTARYYLMPLSRSETQAYVLHRLGVAGAEYPLFSVAALRNIYRYSGGVPRVINIYCHRGMLMAYANQAKQVSREMIKQVYQELSDQSDDSPRHVSWTWMALALLGFALVALLIWNAQELVHLPPSRLSETVIEKVSQVGRYPVADPTPRKAQVAVLSQVAENASHGLDRGESEARVDSDSAQDKALRVIDAKEVVKAEVDRDGLGAVMGNESNAFVTLFGYWQHVYPAEEESRSSCDKARDVGLSCIYGHGAWDNLAYYNRPAVLELIMDDGQRYNVVASGLTDNKVILDLNGKRLDFPHKEIDKLWTGAYIVLWRPPKLSSESLSFGQVGKDVVWLNSMLDRIEGKETDLESINTKFDREMQQRVMRFQRSQGLLADGIVGKQTLIKLNGRVADSTRPVLRREGG
jgi:general secretion pathway protein A